MEAPNLCWVEVIGSSGDENLTDDAILPARSLLQRVYEPLSSLSAAEGGVLQLQADSKPSGIRIDRSCKGKSFLFAIRFPFGRDDASRRPRIALRAFPLRRALVRGFTRKDCEMFSRKTPSHAFSRSAPNDARRHFEALRTHRKRLKQPFAACRMHPPLSRAPSLTETARRIGSSRVYAMRSSSAADLCSKCRIISAAFLRMMMHVDCKWPSLMISKVLSLGLKTSRRQPTGWNRSAQRSGTHSV